MRFVDFESSVQTKDLVTNDVRPGSEARWNCVSVGAGGIDFEWGGSPDIGGSYATGVVDFEPHGTASNSAN